MSLRSDPHTLHNRKETKMAFKFDDFAKEAERRNKKNGIKNEPFQINLKDGRVIEIEAPDANTFLALSDVEEGQVLRQFKILFGNKFKDYNALIEELDGKPMQILNVILEEAFGFWGTDVPAAGKSAS